MSNVLTIKYKSSNLCANKIEPAAGTLPHFPFQMATPATNYDAVERMIINVDIKYWHWLSEEKARLWVDGWMGICSSWCELSWLWLWNASCWEKQESNSLYERLFENVVSTSGSMQFPLLIFSSSKRSKEFFIKINLMWYSSVSFMSKFIIWKYSLIWITSSKMHFLNGPHKLMGPNAKGTSQNWKRNYFPGN